MRQKNFTCVFPSAENVHLVKDVGMIANTMAREHGWDSRLVCLDKGRDFPYLDIADRLAIDRIADDPGYRRFRDPPRSLDAYLRRRARDIDVLQLFHNTRETRRIAVRFRKLNPRGVVYVKLDADEEWLRREIALVRRDRLRWITEHLVAQVFLRRVPDLLTIETDSARRTFSELYPWSAAKLSVLPNGYDENWLRANGLADPGPEDKEDLVIAVGRVGSPQKNHEMLLQALRSHSSSASSFT